MRTLLYPERRNISDDEILSWGFDAAVNLAVDEHVKVHGVFETDAAYTAFAETVERPELSDAIDLLSDLGLATFAVLGFEDDDLEHAFDDEAFERDRERDAYDD